jgi:Flp pilus assembly pilin Flp
LLLLIIWDGESETSDLAFLNQLGNKLKVNRMKNFLMNLWQDESGAETAEWIVIVALVLGVALAIYTGVLQDALQGVVTTITAALDTVTIATVAPTQ